MLDEKTMYAAVKNCDTRLDGKFFVGVTSTGVYCRPVCRARTPKESNCRFFATTAEAEGAGFRPCLLCRPELAPGVAPVDAKAALAHKAARRIRENREGEESLARLAQALGCSDRHLRRAFEAEYHVSPVQYRQTSRLLLAKELLTDTDLPVLDVAMAAGFQSLRRFNALFRSRYRMAPTDLRKRRKVPAGGPGQVTLELKYRPPYRWEALLAFLAQRAIPGVEKVEGGAYLRTVCMKVGEQRHTGWLKVEHRAKREALAVTASASLLPILPRVLDRVKHLFDLYCEPEMIYEALQSMNELVPGLCRPGTRLPGCFDPFEMSVRAVLGQQITVKGATTLSGRMARALGTPVETGVEGLELAFPTAEEILALDGPLEEHLGPLGVIGARSRTIAALARVTAEGTVDFDFPAQPGEEAEKLLALPGIGPWSAQYIAMRTMAWTDAFPDTDLGIRKALAGRGQKEILALAEGWRPWRAYAAINLWNWESGRERGQ